MVKLDLDQFTVSEGEQWGIAFGKDPVGLHYNVQSKANLNKFGPWYATNTNYSNPQIGDVINTEYGNAGKRYACMI